MEHCESKTGGVCGRTATWKQSVHAGGRLAGPVDYYSVWCDEHAQAIADKRRSDWNAVATMTPIAPDVT